MAAGTLLTKCELTAVLSLKRNAEIATSKMATPLHSNFEVISFRRCFKMGVRKIKSRTVSCGDRLLIDDAWAFRWEMVFHIKLKGDFLKSMYVPWNVPRILASALRGLRGLNPPPRLWQRRPPGVLDITIQNSFRRTFSSCGYLLHTSIYPVNRMWRKHSRQFHSVHSMHMLLHCNPPSKGDWLAKSVPSWYEVAFSSTIINPIYCVLFSPSQKSYWDYRICTEAACVSCSRQDDISITNM